MVRMLLPVEERCQPTRASVSDDFWRWHGGIVDQLVTARRATDIVS